MSGDEDDPFRDGASQMLENCYFHRERIEEAEYLIECGMLPALVSELTSWPRRVVRKLIKRAGIKARCGKPRTSLIGILRVPVYHAAISRYVLALDHQIKFFNERKLSSRSVSRAIRYCLEGLPESMVNFVDPSVFPPIGEELLRGNIKITTCRHCDAQYAAFSPQSSLTRDRVFDCPQCRMLAAMVAGNNQMNLRQAIRAKCTRTLSTKRLHAVIDRVLDERAKSEAS